MNTHITGDKNITSAERRVLLWLLRATDCGEIITGADAEQIGVLKGLQQSLMERS